MDHIEKIEAEISKLWSSDTGLTREQLEPKLSALCKALQEVSDLIEDAK